MPDCQAHNFNANRPPTGSDDPCNTSGEGIFETGSYWGYDPTAAGADTATYGDCYRLWQRTGDTCAVAEWLELQLSNPRYETADPTTGDCCPAGTIWVNEISGQSFISYADLTVDPPVCRWCELCPQTLIDEQEISVALEVIATPLAPGYSVIETPAQFITVTNTTDKDMICVVHVNNAQINGVNTDPVTQPIDVTVTMEFTQNGGGTWFSSGEWDTSAHFDVAGTPGDFREPTTGSIHRTYTIAAGVTQTFGVRRTISSTSGFTGVLLLDDLLMNTYCVAV